MKYLGMKPATIIIRHNTEQILRLMVKTAWYDVDQLGRNTGAMLKHMKKKYDKVKDDPQMISLAFAYYDRYMKGVNTIIPLVETMTGVNRLIKDATKLEKPISN